MIPCPYSIVEYIAGRGEDIHLISSVKLTKTKTKTERFDIKAELDETTPTLGFRSIVIDHVLSFLSKE